MKNNEKQIKRLALETILFAMESVKDEIVGYHSSADELPAQCLSMSTLANAFETVKKS